MEQNIKSLAFILGKNDIVAESISSLMKETGKVSIFESGEDLIKWLHEYHDRLGSIMIENLEIWMQESED